ncbi:MAG: glycosyltransferase family 39 protein [Endomicrobiaceae bacterium]|nr:glycosyltransferase family 39 protein [Endomicrobiaceae bacterium]
MAELNYCKYTQTFLEKANSGIIFLFIAVVYIICNFIWWQSNTPVIPAGGSAEYFIYVFRGKGLSLHYIAPLVTWIMRGMFGVFGQKYFDLQIIFVNYIFFLIPLYFIYKIGTELKDRETGRIAMMLFALTPAVYGMTRQYGHHDYHIIAGITFNIYCLIKTNYFTDRKWSIIYGISTGIALLIKDFFAVYFFAPWLYMAIQSLKEKGCNRHIIINILLAIGAGSLIAGIHYFRLGIIMKMLYDPISNSTPIFLFENMRAMTIGLYEELLSPPLFILFLVGFVWFIWKYKNKRNKIIMLLWFLTPWTIIFFMPQHKVSEWGAGFIPAIILITSVYLSNIKIKNMKILILSLMLLIGVLQLYVFSYMPERNFLNIGFKFKNHYISYYNNKFNYYDAVTAKNMYDLISYIKIKYPKEIFYVEITDYEANRILEMLAAKEKIKMFALEDWIWNNSFNGISKIKYIIFIGKKITTNDRINVFMKLYDQELRLSQKTPREEYLNSIRNMMEKFGKTIEQDFKTVEIWHPENDEENLGVEFLKRIKE